MYWRGLLGREPVAAHLSSQREDSEAAGLSGSVGSVRRLRFVVAAFRPERLLVPLVTPFDASGRVDQDSLERHADVVLSAGAAGVVALATTGEASSLDEGERAAVVAVCARVCADCGGVLVVGAGTNDTRTTIERHAALADVPGVRASLAVVPYYVRPSETAIVSHFQAVASRSPVPLIVYNIPYRTGRGLGAAATLELADTDNVAGLKQAVGGIDADTLEVLARAPAQFSVLGGDDAFLYPLVLMGAAGRLRRPPTSRPTGSPRCSTTASPVGSPRVASTQRRSCPLFWRCSRSRVLR